MYLIISYKIYLRHIQSNLEPILQHKLNLFFSIIFWEIVSFYLKLLRTLVYLFVIYRFVYALSTTYIKMSFTKVFFQKKKNIYIYKEKITIMIDYIFPSLFLHIFIIHYFKLVKAHKDLRAPNILTFINNIKRYIAKMLT